MSKLKKENEFHKRYVSDCNFFWKKYIMLIRERLVRYMPYLIKNAIEEFLQSIRNCFGENLKSVIVYGSYARGDYNQSSDIDIMILVSLSDEEIKNLEDVIYDSSFDLEMKYGKVLSPIIKNNDFFEYWSDTLPFYQNIKSEGVKFA